MKSIDAKLLKEMLISAANNLYNHYPEIDALNVFPVPDGDTGMNMNLTLSSGAKQIANRNDEDVYNIAKEFSKGLLLGARGNSGVITSQIFRGFAMSLEGKKVIKVNDLVDAFVSAKEVAYKAVIRPVEGTILTVLRESSDTLEEKVKSDTSIEKALDILVSSARESLSRTPDLLPVLKEVGVVDSGGTGYLRIVEGLRSAAKGVFIEKINATETEAKPTIFVPAAEGEGEEYGYCTEFIMRLGPAESKKQFNELRFRSVLESRGNSIVLVTDDDIVKVHIHTLKPGEILNYAQNFGEFVTLKIENMTEQHTRLHEGAKELSENKPEEPKEDFAIVAVAAGDGVKEMFINAGAKKVVSGGQTMNPSTEDIVKAIREANAETVFVLPNNSNIIMASMQAKDVLDGEVDVRVIQTKTVPQGIASCSAFNPDANADENEEEMSNVIDYVKSGSITYAIKDTTIDGIDVKKDQFMEIFDKKIIGCKKDKYSAFYDLVKAMVDEDSYLITAIVGEDISSEEANKIKSKLQEIFPEIELDVVEGKQPVYSFLIGVE